MTELDKILNGWKINNNYAHFLLKNLKAEWLNCVLYEKSRTIEEQFDHIIRMRLMWSSKINNKLGNESAIKTSNKNSLFLRLDNSSKRIIETFNFLNICDNDKFELFTLYTRLITHESHHRSQIIAIIKVNHLEINPYVNYGLWNWGHNFNKK